MKRLNSLLPLAVLVALFAMVGGAEASEMVEEAVMTGKDWFLFAIVITSGFALSIASGLAALGQGKAVAQTAEAIARQPSAAGELFRTLIIGLAFIESLALYVLVIAMILFFANPFAGVYGL